jgi:UDP-N-acetylglucosamine 2-epimerase (non-hydrolysing)/GDP/UDP-N,N'-diacetylbacillosamine 2-epimerase (hydrolysing)
MASEIQSATSQAIGSGIIEISKILEKIGPDILVVYADRFEGLAAVVAATQMNIPTAHIEGGDITEGGALDDSVRHAMTKLAHIHFSTNEQATNRILGMGEEKWRVHTVGFPAIDLISEGTYATPLEIESNLNIDLSKPIVLFTQHSVTTEYQLASDQMNESIQAIQRLANDGIQVILTYPNNDAGGQEIIETINRLVDNPNIIIKSSLGRYLYHGVLALSLGSRHLVVCAGNSSSGIKETPVFGCPTVNIGSRQEGRLRGQNVIDVDYKSDEIYQAISKSLFDENFRIVCRKTENPYGLGGAGEKIAQVLAEIPLDKKLLRKKMTLRGETSDGWFR